VSASIQDLPVAEGIAPSPRRRGFFLGVLRDRKAAVVGLAIIAFFVVLALVAPYISPYSASAQSCPCTPRHRFITGLAATTAASTCSAS
jgi:hypothetical protein